MTRCSAQRPESATLQVREAGFKVCALTSCSAEKSNNGSFKPINYLDDMVRRAPRESGDSRLVHDKLVEFHFHPGPATLRELQAPVETPGAAPTLSALSQWIVDFAVARRAGSGHHGGVAGRTRRPLPGRRLSTLHSPIETMPT